MNARNLFCMLLLTAAVAGCNRTAPPAEDQNTKSETMKSEKMIIARVSIKPENVSDFIKAAQGIIKSSNDEAGCLEYVLYQNPYDSTSFVFVEKYVDQAAIDFHFGTDYFRDFGTTIGGWTKGPADIRIIDIAGERTP